GEVELERDGAVDHRVDLPVRVEVHVGAVHLEEDARVVLDALERVHRARRFVEEGAGAVHVVVLLVLPRPGAGVAPDRAGVAVGLHLVAGPEDVLDDPEPLAALHPEPLGLVSAPHLAAPELVPARAECPCAERHASRVLAAPEGTRSRPRRRRPARRRASRAAAAYRRPGARGAAGAGQEVRMRVGILGIFQNYLGREGDDAMVRDEMRLAELAEPLGYDSYWPPEHHF